MFDIFSVNTKISVSEKFGLVLIRRVVQTRISIVRNIHFVTFLLEHLPFIFYFINYFFKNYYFIYVKKKINDNLVKITKKKKTYKYLEEGRDRFFMRII